MNHPLASVRLKFIYMRPSSKRSTRRLTSLRTFRMGILCDRTAPCAHNCLVLRCFTLPTQGMSNIPVRALASTRKLDVGGAACQTPHVTTLPPIVMIRCLSNSWIQRRFPGGKRNVEWKCAPMCQKVPLKLNPTSAARPPGANITRPIDVGPRSDLSVLAARLELCGRTRVLL